MRGHRLATRRLSLAALLAAGAFDLQSVTCFGQMPQGSASFQAPPPGGPTRQSAGGPPQQFSEPQPRFGQLPIPAAQAAAQRRMGVLEFGGQAQQQSRSEYITVVGAVTRSVVCRTSRVQVSLAELIRAAGGPSANANGSIELVRDGQTRFHLFGDSLNSTIVSPGDTIVVQTAAPAPGATPDANEASARCPIVCLNLLERPVLLYPPAESATVAAITAKLGQPLDSVPPSGVVLPAPREALSPWMRLDSGTILNFSPASIDGVRLQQALSQIQIEPFLDLDRAAAAQAVTATLPLAPPPTATPFVPQIPSSAAPLPDFSVASTPLPAPMNAAPLVPPQFAATSSFSQPEMTPAQPRLISSGRTQTVELVDESQAITAAHESSGPATVTTASSFQEAELDFDPLAKIQAPASSTGSIYGWLAGLSALSAAAAGGFFWLRANRNASPYSVGNLPIVEAAPSKTRTSSLHGKMIGDKKLAVDPPHTSVAGPHFEVTNRQSTRVSPTSKSRRKTREKVAVETPSALTEAPHTGGLLDRVLTAMDRERSE
jgi:hypothetical protein